MFNIEYIPHSIPTRDAEMCIGIDSNRVLNTQIHVKLYNSHGAQAKAIGIYAARIATHS